MALSPAVQAKIDDVLAGLMNFEQTATDTLKSAERALPDYDGALGRVQPFLTPAVLSAAECLPYVFRWREWLGAAQTDEEADDVFRRMRSDAWPDDMRATCPYARARAELRGFELRSVLRAHGVD